ncbi:undecaprenyl-diphosphatase [Pseudomonas sp. MAFF 302046]|uniref:undecaprenyl-diphosphate phosphatase n=1 Tax=Pseudomonas morbosilactucae TaxID=2938197 RepID=A0ABT0JJQ9_9PSED|nr:undecaprenyl-diphosphatase [Pseudomonas morbosilactucae]MCK9816024.1 undecaprenyl-diphosphatase [Pseudomonas morbosilactucae]
MEELNRSLFLAINASAEASLPMRELAIFFAQWMVFCVPLLLAVLWIFGEQRQRRVVLLAGVSIALALACNLVIRELWFHPRPFMLGLGQNFLAHAPGASFPSDHASGLFAMAFALILASLRKTGLVMLGLALLVSWARVYLGVHFPLDILGGCLVGLLSAWLVRQGLAWRQLDLRLLALLEGVYLRLLAVGRRNA